LVRVPCRRSQHYGRLPQERDNFGYLHFGPEHIGVWRVSLGIELGEGAKVAEYVRVPPERFPGKARQAAFYADLGRGLASERSTRERGIHALARAEAIAPQLIRNNVFVRETVADLLIHARKDAGGRELRRLVWRMGIAPTGLSLRLRSQRVKQPPKITPSFTS
jgi:hypothetical protein